MRLLALPFFLCCSSCWDGVCSGRGSDGGSVEAQVHAFYSRHNPDKISKVPKILRQYKGREGLLLADLKKKYGVQDGDGPVADSQLLEQGERGQSSCDVTSRQSRAGLHWLWGTPVYVADLEIGKDVVDAVVGEITGKYFEINDTLYEEGMSPAKVNDAFYGWQQELDGAWMDARLDCFSEYGLDPDGPSEDEALSDAPNQRHYCEQSAVAAHWASLREMPEWIALMQQVEDHCHKYLAKIGLHDVKSRGSFEYGPSGRELLWSWASVHHDGIEHLIHDHPASLLSGTVWLKAPPGAGRLQLSDMRESRKGGAVYNIDLMFEKWLPDASSGFTELVCVFAGCALLLFDLALVAVFCPRAGWGREAIMWVQLLASGAVMVLAVFVLWMLSTEFDDDIDFPFGETLPITPSAGRVVVFPGWLLHRVEPSPIPAAEPRVAISFNIRGIWKPTGSGLESGMSFAV